LKDKTIKLYNTDIRERLEEETYEEYKIRQKLNTIMSKAKLKGGLWWDSSRWGTMTQEKLNHIMAQSIKPETLKTEEV
jgi:hypothetical protein